MNVRRLTLFALLSAGCGGDPSSCTVQILVDAAGESSGVSGF